MTITDAADIARALRKAGFLYRTAIMKASEQTGIPYADIASELGKYKKSKKQIQFKNYN